MGFGTGLPLWVLMLMICCIQQKASGTESPEPVTIIPPQTAAPVITSFNPAHNGRVCSTWGNFYYKTFDGDIYHFPGVCNYVFASHCNTPFEDFNIQIRHSREERTIHQITIILDGVHIEMEMDGISVNNERVQLPYSGSGFRTEIAGNYMIMSAKIVQLMWNKEDNIMLELDPKYANQTCGLCGDFNGIPTYNEFYSNNAKITPLQFGNMQKMNGPTEDCEDPTSSSLINCANVSTICQEILMGPAFSDCNDLVGVNEYIESCGQDLCFCDQNTTFSCLCDTFAEYSRQCAHAGGHPQNWRNPDLCPMTCPFNMQYQECGSPCADTCTNSERSQLCEDHCLDGCFCPSGTVYDDINNSGCVPIQECSCVYNGKAYAPGTTYSDHCRSCSCSGGQWSCTDIPCPGICSVEGGSHISTYDEKHYNVHGDCTYVLSKVCDEETFTVLGELRKCGLTDTETCLKMVALSFNGGLTTIVVKPGGAVFVNWIYTQLPISTANVTVFSPSSYFIIMATNVGLQLEIQHIPIMQLFVHLDPSFKGKTCGLCGNFDSRQIDDFRAISGVVEGTAPAFANTWKTQAICPNIKQNFEDPCSLSIENEKYAHHWCGLLTDSEGPFGKCHSSLNPATYHKNCMFDTCNCERSEDCMCAALSAYVRACAAKGVELPGWRTSVCTKYMTSCPESQNYSYTISSCTPTCRSLSEHDVICKIKFVPVDGCTCTNGTFLNDDGKCVPANQCPCYYRGTAVLPGEVLHDTGTVCTCAQGKLNCIGDGVLKPVCTAPMVYFDCKNATTGSTGAECQKSCQTLDMQCYSTQCMSGCMCPTGLVSDGKGKCIAMEECPCIHNDVVYNPGEKIKVDCNTCVCKNRMWKCTKNKCLGTCAVYGDGHYITFDDKRYNFNGKCEYTLVQDHCGQNNFTQGTFRIITENIPCGSTGTTCSKSIKVFFENYELILSEEQSKVITRGGGGTELPYRIRNMGIYLVIESISGMIILWDKKTSIVIKMSPDFKGQVCGLCGNYDGNGINDFTTRSQSIVGDVLEFGNSWKVSPTCPDAKCIKDPCSKNPYRKSWSQKQCSIINSKVFAACHSQVEPTKYYEACVTDACACDTGGDCECFCTAVAAYAQACSEFGVCVSWRTPSVCPMFCDYYNAERECDWHYKPCGAPCMKTCRNRSGRCLYQLPGLEGCYPHCPSDKPYFNEEEMKCVGQCGCYDAEDNYYPLGTHFDLRDTCQSCICTSEGIMCNYDDQACYCYYEGKKYIYKQVIYNTTDGMGWCMTATCDVNRTIHRNTYRCVGTTTLPPFTFTTIPSTSGTESTTPATTTCVHKQCQWSEWYDVSYPTAGQNNGDYETPDMIRAKGHNICKFPDKVECRAELYSDVKIENLNQTIQCTKNTGLICNNKDQMPPICHNYQIKFLCCIYTPCEISSPTTPSVPISTTLEVTEFTPTACLPECTWTAWFDVSDPENGDGDMETPKAIREAGNDLCDNPQNIECRAQLYREVPISQLQQKVLCNTQDGLQCRDLDQMGKYKKCLNYESRYYCCDYAHCRTTSMSGTTTVATSTSTPASTPGTTVGQTSTLPSSSAGSTPRPTLPPSTQRTTVVATSPGKETATTLSTPLSTAQATSLGAVSTPSVTSATASTATATSLQSTPVSKPTGSIPTQGSTPQASSTAVGTTTVVTPIGTTTSSVTESISTVCQPECTWTAWFDVSDPENGDGDMETPKAIREAGNDLCDNPQNIECRAQLYREVPISQLQQKVLCNTQDGLQCRDLDQMGKYKKCLNYESRYYCCDYAHCRTTSMSGTTTVATSTSTPASTPGTTIGQTSTLPSSSASSTPRPTLPPSTQRTTVVATSPGKETATTLSTPLSTAQATSLGAVSTPSVTSATASTATATSLQSTPVSKTTGSIPTQGSTPQASSTAVGTTTVVTPIGTTTSSVTESISTVCQPECTWTAWFDVSDPENGDGDMETPKAIREAGNDLCDNPQNIECRAQLYREVPISQLQQKVLCNTQDGLQCRDLDQMGKYKKCLNYESRYYCCDYAHCRTTSMSGTTTVATSTSTPASTPGTTVGQTSTLPSSSASSTPRPTLPPSTQRTTVVATSPGKETATTLSTPLSTAQATSLGAVSTPSVTSATASTATATSLQSTPVSKTTGSIPTQGSTPQASSTAVGTTTVVTPIGTTTSSVTESISTVCQPECTWTAWFDVSDPENGDGDMETPKAIREAGNDLCDNPQNIECRAQLYREVPISQLQQKVLCNTQDGLQCRDLDQMGKYKKCLNYESRYYCCDYAHCRTTSMSGTTTVATSTSTPASTPGTTVGQTSTLPSSSAGSTPRPTLPPSTQRTTVVATSPGKETATTLSTPLSTAQATSLGAVSTPSVTSATASTATATSLQSTPLSKPTGSIPTQGSTPQASSTAVGTTTVVTPIGTTTSSVTESISTVCQPECTWTAWFDVSDPENGDGDMETPKAIREAGNDLCDNPQNIECRAQLYREVPISQLQQKVLCNTQDGLQCRDLDQMGKYKKCLNYESRYYCCDYAHCRTTSMSGTTTVATSTSTPASTPGITVGQTSTLPSSSAGSTPRPTLPPSTQRTTVVATSPGKETATTLSTPLSTAQATSLGAVSTPSVTSATASTATATSLQSTPVSKPTGSIPTQGSTPQASSTAVGTTTVVTPIGTRTSSVTESISTVCQPECTWTAWFDVSDPENGDGDMETPKAIREAGNDLCDKPQNIECRAQLYREVPISQLQQKVLCNTQDGLQCRDLDQMGKYKKCLNYESRYYCCDYAHCRTTSMSGTTTVATSTSTPASTPGTTVGQTSTLPSSSAGSTPRPTLPPSTQRTTVVATSPGKETATTLSTPLSTAQATSLGAVSTPSVTSATASTATATSLQSTPVSKPTGSIPTQGSTPQASSTAVGTTTVVTPIGTTTSSVTESISTVCQPECTWTAWFDVSDPENGDGDMETPKAIREAGNDLCDNPQNIECRAQLYREVPISQLQQKVLCNTQDGLQCRDLDQMGKYKKCLNYESRYYCCDYAHCRTTSMSGTTTVATSTSTPASTPGTTVGQTSTLPSSSAGSTPRPTLPPSTQRTTVVATSPGKETATTLSTPLSTAQATSLGAVSTPSVTSATASTATATSLQSTPVSKPTGSIPTQGSTPQASSTAVGTTTVVTPIGTTTSSVTESISTVCQPECTWTAWFDVSDPENGDGDMETPKAIREAGNDLCDNPQNIECRAQLYREVPISQLQQKVLCNTQDGLQCRDLDQMGKYKKCLNYESRYYCCDYAHCRTTSMSGTTTVATSTSTPASTPGITVGQTSTLPSSSAGSTPRPTLPPSTQRTTVVATSPGKETATTLSTPLSTAQATSLGAVSTPSVTSATASTATATSLQSTPVSKPTGSIPTQGSTPQASSTAVGTTTVVTPIGTTTSSVTESISTVCQPECTWTAWFDVSDPENGDGDMETPKAIREAGNDLCDNPQNIECRAQLYREVPISQLQQKVLCNTQDGLQCRDLDQMGKYKKCLNYESRYYCCDYAHCRTTSMSGTTTVAISTSTPASTPGTTVGQTSTLPSSSAGSTPRPTLPPSTQRTTVVATSPGKETATTLSTPLSTAQATSLGAISTPSVTSATASTATATSLQSTPVSKPTGSIPTQGSTPQASSTAVGTTTVVTPIGTTTSSVTESISTVCQPECTWTAWFDVSDPENGDGDMETPKAIREAGNDLCDNPQNIECRAQLYREVPISQLQQKVLCNTQDGLQCRDLDQMGKYKKCLNYESRYYCCDYAHCRTTSMSGTTTVATSTSTPASTPGTTVGQTSTLPSSSAGSTPRPTLPPSTQRTTVVATSPGKETATTLSTPLSTAQATSLGAVSTPSVTSATASTATATSLQSTPVSKPTGSIPTQGSTPQASSTAVGTTTVVTPIGTTTSSVTESISTVCQPECTWTAWFDVSDPENGDGDMETPKAIREAGNDLCDNPQNIECRAQLYREVPISQLQQKVLCNTQDGLQCRDLDQMGKYKKCLNYESRYYCCHYAHCRTTSMSGTTTVATSTSTPASTPGTTVGQTSTLPSSSAGSTPRPTLPPSTQRTTVVATSPGKETATTLSTPLSTAQATSLGAVSTPSVTSATASTATATSLQSTPVSKPTGSIPTQGSTPQASSTAVGTTTVVTPIGTTTSSVTESISTVCQPECTWTAWFDVSDPENGDGDMETPKAIREAGNDLCDNPQNIECRAQLYREVPISQLQQKVLCNTQDGLQCRDLDQMGKYKKCLNYESRYYCCDYAHCRTTSMSGTTTVATSTSTPASTPGTTVGQTSTLPSSSAGSTPRPTLPPSTQRTTVVATSPGKETATTLSTPLSTAQATSLGAVSTPSVTSATASTATATSLQSTPVSKPTGSIPTQGSTPQASSTAVGTTIVVTPIGTTTSSVTESISTVCQPECTWTAWFDVSDPENGDGDMETPKAIREAGNDLCDNPQNIECRAQLYREVPISQLQQKVLCNTQDGLQCRDLDQMGKYKKCLNYESRYYCCDYAHCRTTSMSGTTTVATSTSTPASTPGTTVGQTSTLPSSSAGSTPRPTLPPSTQRTTVVATSPGKETATTLSTPLSTAQATSLGAVSTPSVTSATASTATATSLQSTPVSKTTGSIPTQGSTPQASSTAVGTTTVVTPIGTTTSSVTESISTVCQPECTWTAWFDVSDPENGDGDMETPKAIREAGNDLCDNPQNIECRAQLYREVPISQLQQKVLCNTQDGLQCRDLDQMGKYKKCLNYESRYYCCDYAHCRTTSMSGTTTVATSTSTPASTPGTTVGQTSTLPSSSAGSTPRPTLPPSTQRTTVVATSPGKETATTLSTPLSTAQATSLGAVSTPSVTSATASTATATSLQSTPVSKPTGSIPTQGSTPQASSTAVGTTTVVTPIGTTTSSVTESISTVCQPECTWTAWFDVSDPENGDGDMETPKAIREAGKDLCDNPQNIECRAQLYREVPISQLQQKVLCNTQDGLQCRDLDQMGKYKKCLNYESRYYCCDYAHCRTTSMSGTTTVATSTSTPASTPGTTVGQTSTLPSSSAGSTPRPTLPPSTQRTTVVATSPGKETATTLSTPLSTAQATSLGAVSTPSVTSATASTATATSLQSTPVSKTTGSIPTQGSTPQASSTAVGTTTVVTPIGTTTSSVTESISTVCQPECTWTAWFDVSDPENGDGDMETPKAIREAGKDLCDNPQNIECRAQLYREVPISQLQQKVLCNTQDGLQCRDLDQMGKYKKCLNYESRYYCCDYAHCPTTSMSGTTTVATSTSTPASTPGTTVGQTSTLPSSSAGSTPRPTLPPSTHGTTLVATNSASATKTATASSTLTSSRITPCFCHVSGAAGGLFSPGEVIYNKTDSSGCHFYAICDNNCEIKRSQETCPSPTPSRPPTPSVTTLGTSSIPSTPTPTILIPSTVERTSLAPPTGPVVKPTTPVQDCPNIDPPRKTNETWMLNNCSMATCEGNNRIVVVLPPPVDRITCVNRLPPVKIYHDDGCTYHYDCTCVCSGWDNSHYETFDGSDYTFHDNCTYVLVQEIVKKHGNFSVLVDNYYCDPADNQSCSRSIIIHYNHVEVVLSSQMYNGMRTNKVIFNKETVHASFSKDGIIVADTGTSMSVEILDIHAFINFNGFTFSIKVPFDLFAFNTEGQCGTCSNDRSDDCRLPNGHKASSCSEMAPHWKVNDSCVEAIPTPEPTGATPTPSEITCTTPSPLCELIVSDIFADCHKVLPPKVFYDHCLSEACQNANDSLTCYSVEMYASLCIDKGFCTDWRSKTKGKCPYHCPKDKVYEACGPVYPATCDNGKAKDITEHVAEGCFCPADQILVNSHSDTCVPDCNFCIGPEGFPKMPGTKWKSNCQECICDQLSVTVQCKEQPCPTSVMPACEKEGFMPVSVLTPEDPCCPEIQCLCNISACSNRKKSCEPGYQLASVLFEGDCCVTFLCEPMPDICLVNGTVYMPGVSIPSDNCETCVCGNETDLSSKRNLVECEPIPCDTACSVGYEYQVKTGECCGTCVQVTCTININGTAQVLKPGDIWQPEGNNCSQYECEKEDNELVLVNTRRTCPIFDPKECGPDETELTPDGCCKICKPQNCKVRRNQILIRQNECVSSELVELTYCEGTCPSSSMYSTEARTMQHKCTCCQELKSHKKEVSLTCQDGRTINYDYIYVDECQCMTACIPEATTSH